MKVYIVTFAVGLLIGAIYSLLNVRSPAPPVIALVGLLGILLGEQALPIAKRFLSGDAVTTSWLSDKCGGHVFGMLPGHSRGATDQHLEKEVG
jgi:XapX domain-containing protein